MFAGIHAHEAAERLLECAQSFSPHVEPTAPDTVLLDASGLTQLIGPPHEIANAIARRAGLLGLKVNVAIASNPDAAYHAALGFPGISIVPYGDEAKFLATLPVHLLPLEESMAETLERWGIRVFRDLAMLPELGVAARLGAEGVRLQRLARGESDRRLRRLEDELRFEEDMELEHPVALMEPLSFLLAQMLTALCARLQERAFATNELRLTLGLENGKEHERVLRLPVPMRDWKAFLKLLQLDLNDHPPDAPVKRIRLVTEPARPRTAQSGLFIPLAPEPEKLELTLARIGGVVGKQNVGSPELIDTHRQGAFHMRAFTPENRRRGDRRSENRDSQPFSPPEGPFKSVEPDGENGDCPKFSRALADRTDFFTPLKQTRLALRVYRPPRSATVNAPSGRPAFVSTSGVHGKVLSLAGPWRSSGDWWTTHAWSRDEWDVSLSDGALYRIFCDCLTGRWYVEGNYD